MKENERDEFKNLSRIEEERTRRREAMIRSEADKRDTLFWKFEPLVHRICLIFYESVKSTGWVFSYFNFPYPGDETAFLIYKPSYSSGVYDGHGPWICVVLTTSSRLKAFGGFEAKDGVYIRGGGSGTFHRQDLNFGEVTWTSFPLLEFKKYESFISLDELNEESLAGKIRECFLMLI